MKSHVSLLLSGQLPTAQRQVVHLNWECIEKRILFRNRRPRFGLSGLGHVKSPVIAIVFLKSAVLSKRKTSHESQT